MQLGFTCKDECTSNLGEIRKALKQNTLNFARVFCAEIKNFLAFTAFFSALPQLLSAQTQTYIDRNDL